MGTSKLETVAERIRRHVLIDANGCWLWTASLSHRGYARLNNPRGEAAHRLSYAVAYGPIPAGLTIDHLCRVRHCVNPAHLEPVTNAENHRRIPRPPTCSRGHVRTAENTTRKRSGGIAYCKVCRNDQRRTRYATDSEYREATISRIYARRSANPDAGDDRG